LPDKGYSYLRPEVHVYNAAQRLQVSFLINSVARKGVSILRPGVHGYNAVQKVNLYRCVTIGNRTLNQGNWATILTNDFKSHS